MAGLITFEKAYLAAKALIIVVPIAIAGCLLVLISELMDD